MLLLIVSRPRGLPQMALANYKISKDILLSVFVPAAVSGSLLCGIRFEFRGEAVAVFMCNPLHNLFVCLIRVQNLSFQL